ncbi:hypothetical protein HB662_26910 [Roseomonas frigidaquae]|uniref:Transcriptional regulator n=1 Tax=Falsiroseomonas frigidaquae TaxID=487318 RepID=A0ABX1F7S1_9PROT|nr:hypothetical protein [Falsiroseomonas frigidaquae]NKE48433.1 hypothetical protein [Falsiroseomonas frigidaquae]
MNEQTACAFTSQSRRDFRALVSAGLLPPGRSLLPDRPAVWHREEVEKLTARIWGLGLAEREAAASRAMALAAVQAYDPSAGRPIRNRKPS